MQLLSVISLCILLGGCGAPMPKPPKFDSYLTTECGVLQNTIGFKSFEGVLEQKAKDVLVLIECAKKHNGLVEAVKKYEVEFNATK
jgi:hypothetical protein